MSPSIEANRSQAWRFAIVDLALLSAATAVCAVLDPVISLMSQAMIYLLAVVAASYLLPRLAAVGAAIGAVAALNFFFVPPRYTLAVEHREHLIALVAMLAVALLVSYLSGALKRESAAARESESRAGQLRSLAIDLAAAGSEAEAVDIGRRALLQYVAGPVVLVTSVDGAILPGADASEDVQRALRCCIDEAAVLGPGTGRWPGLDAWYVPLGTSDRVVGAVRIEPALASDTIGREHAQAIAALVAQGVWRLRLLEANLAARAEVERQHVQATFLASVSHDLRTPLAAITGAASGLLVEPPPAPELRFELASTVLDEAQRLNRLVGNLLDMTRLEAGTLEPKRDWHSLEELIGSAIARVEGYARGCRFAAEVAPELPLVPIDAVLVEQALVNLLENAVRHGGPDGVVRVAARRDGGAALVEVTDDGPGLAPGDEARVFDKFYRAAGGPGAGLGLAIARAIVTAHGGRIWAENLTPRGAAFRFTLPLGDAPPPPPLEELA